MFSFTKKKSAPTTTDKVWKTKTACYKGLVTEARKAMHNGDVAVVFTFFSADHDALVRFLDDEHVPHTAEGSGNPALLYVLDILSVGKSTLDTVHRQGSAHGVRILFLGHYPLPEPEQKALDQLSAHWGAVSATFFLSLEDGLFRHFGSDRIKTLMETMQMKDDEFVEHRMVSRAIQNAREKLAKEITAETKTKSESDWFTRNVNSILS